MRDYLEITPPACFSSRYWLLVNSAKHQSYSDFHLKHLWQAHYISTENRKGKTDMSFWDSGTEKHGRIYNDLKANICIPVVYVQIFLYFTHL